jgi:hypothetical protein
MNKITVRINVDGLAKGLKKGDTVIVNVDEHGTPFDIFWFKRFRDSDRDNCITILKKEIKKAGGK